MKQDPLQDALNNIKDEYILEAHEERIHHSIPPQFIKVGMSLLCCFILIIGLPKVLPHGNENYKEEMSYEDDGGYYMEAPSEEAMDTTSNKKVIESASINLETKDIDSLNNKLETLVKQYEGYIESSNMYSNTYKSYYLGVRIPNKNLDSFIQDTKELGNVTYYSRNAQDITKDYTDYSAKLDSLKKEKERLMQFYDQATNVEELMSVEQRISEVQYEIESYQSMIDNYDSLVDYSYVDISINQTSSYTNTETGLFSRLIEALVNGTENFFYILEDFIITLVYNIWLIIILILGFIGYKIYKKRK